MSKVTSRGYIASHIALRSEIFMNWANFSENLKKGPEYMKKYLLDLWNGITNETINQEFTLIDINREITMDDFDITTSVLENQRAFFFVFPDPDTNMAQAKCVGLIMAPQMPRYFTMEIDKIEENGSKYMICEWIVRDGKFVHNNYGPMKTNTIDEFASLINMFLQQDSKKNSEDIQNTAFKCGLKEETRSLVDFSNISYKDLFSICIGRVYAAQIKFIEYVGKYEKWSTDVTIGKLTLDDREYDVEYIGTTAPKEDNLWYSSELEKVIPDPYVNLMIRTRKIMENLGIGKYAAGKIEMTEEVNAPELSMIYIAMCPQRVAYFCGSGDTNVYMFVKNLPESIFKELDPNEFLSRTMEIISTYEVNAKLMVKAFLIENNTEYVEKDNNIIAKFDNEKAITFIFDGNRLLSAEGNL